MHLGLLLPAAGGLMLAILFFAKSTDYPIGDFNTLEVSRTAWEQIAKAIPAPMPSDYEDDEAFSNIESADDLGPADEKVFAENNAFLVSCSLLVLLGCLGISVLGMGARISEPFWNSLLRGGTILFIGLFSFYAWGFNLAFPGDHFGIFPRVYFGFPGSLDPVEYGLSGISEWADLLYIATYAVFMGCLIVSFGSAGLTTKSSLIIATPLIAFFFPLSTSTVWGGGWIDSLGYSVDFAGAALVHWHVGSIALLIGGVLTYHRKSQSLAPLSLPDPAGAVAGAILYFVGILGINAGSTLSAKPDIVAAVIQSTVYAAISAAIVCAATSTIFPKSNVLRFLLAGLLAGAVSVSGSADTFTQVQSIIVGIIGGAGVAATLVLFDRLDWADPFAIGPIHGVGGAIAVMATWFGSLGTDYPATIFGQILLLIAIPFLSLLFTAVILLIAGATKLLSVETGKSREKSGPPSLPRTS